MQTKGLASLLEGIIHVTIDRTQVLVGRSTPHSYKEEPKEILLASSGVRKVHIANLVALNTPLLLLSILMLYKRVRYIIIQYYTG
jgi:hypothetical protein